MPQDAPVQVKYIDLTLDKIDHQDSIMLMGALCANVLREKGQITLFLDRDKRVQQAMPMEVELDMHDEGANTLPVIYWIR